MEITSVSAIRVIDDTSTFNILSCSLVTLFSLNFILTGVGERIEDLKFKHICLSVIVILGLIVVVVLANTKSMYHSIGKYQYQGEYKNNAPDIDSSKFTITGNEIPKKLTVEFKDNLTEEEERAIEKTHSFVKKVALFRIACGLLCAAYFGIIWAKLMSMISNTDFLNVVHTRWSARLISVFLKIVVTGVCLFMFTFTGMFIFMSEEPFLL